MTEAEFLTVTEAAAILRIGRTHAYELARSYRTTNGQTGLPVIVVGSRLLVSRTALNRFKTSNQTAIQGRSR
jgi:excisionase family DNA binding protein